RRSIRTLELDHSELPVGGTVGVQAKRNGPVDVSSAPVNVRHRDALRNADASRLELRVSLLHCADQRRLDAASILAIPLVVRAPEQNTVDARSPHFRRRMRVCDAPPNM